MPELSDHRPLGFRGDLSLSPEQVEMMRSLEGSDLWFVEERLIGKGSVAADKVQGAVVEFKRYMALVGLGYRSLGMLSPEVDEVWHAFILFTREYAEFCQAAFGSFVHHVPRTSRSPRTESNADNFLAAYGEVFGEVPPEWYGVRHGGRSAMADEPSGCGTEDCTDG
ncbi:MAG TPA: hypothetical protein VJ160_09105 [Anaerolineales bacterium]|nr:hypothetical protein [Anaerolineales bacterium]